MRRLLVSVGAVVLAATGVTAATVPEHDEGRVGVSQSATVQQLRVQVLEKRPHAADAFTEGFEISDGVLYEGTATDLRATDPRTGAILKKVAVDPSRSPEGIAVVGDTIWELTWQEGKALRWDRRTLTKVGEAGYPDGWGWGLCYDGTRLVRGDGTGHLYFHDPRTFAELGRVDITVAGVPVSMVNELECVHGEIWANVWKSEKILRIDPHTGRVTAVVDASGLYAGADPNGENVLNGIAAIPGTNQFLITGKMWPTTFRVAFVPQR